jgi:hypothetical protein
MMFLPRSPLIPTQADATDQVLALHGAFLRTGILLSLLDASILLENGTCQTPQYSAKLNKIKLWF